MVTSMNLKLKNILPLTLVLLNLCVTQTIVNGLLITSNTFLKGDHVFNGTVTVEKGATLNLEGGTYHFDGDLNVHGTLNANYTYFSLNQFSSVNITGLVELYASGIDTIIIVKTFYNSGYLYLESTTELDRIVQFEVSASNEFVNDGSIYLGRKTTEFLLGLSIGAQNGIQAPFTNNGLVNVCGFNKVINGTDLYVENARQLAFYTNVEGSGTMKVKNAVFGIGQVQFSSKQNIVLDSSALLPMNVNLSIAVHGLSSSLIIMGADILLKI
ncbi:uncharacterized protein KNAG_0J03000 [Huiozyma naganishii CBS 8797]|uniref:Hyphally-regulated cell wall protein N-terminal domain-containing protein n=1 Tax=Huiozyma naganishii (strain ATCC MYA-139 / BCRC 22969 / CBS 8797 / KCTC 17520 / NBRC 10181 / NCYC 3082 / Yp74L-3) TaxID=1071383 RepID=J7RR98_HUIN7|nr:hypothetical protein KNAG_0J03000 [Kazachstania naganishii CBS 8797]CCK72378.1 hypothetical protein KNAG_0J03000 [Kazachstania naganishii CBS 8797]